ncbi:MAG: hypothetical protein OEV44_00830 [Spirochaetota bacterium]|nr:hypothetical protein [Spirochaetota bacterium]
MKRIIDEKTLMTLMSAKSMYEISNHFVNNKILTIDDFWKIEEKVFNKIKESNK